MRHLLPCLLLGSGCLVPIPLDREAAGDEGQILVVKEAEPPFGVRRAIRLTDPLELSITVQTDGPIPYGRLYRQVNETCCELMLKDPSITHYVKDATEITLVGPGQYRMVWSGVLPCYQPVPTMATAYVVPVLSTAPFLYGPTESLETTGVSDRSHFWAVRCP